MKRNKLKIKLTNDNGITLVALVITIAIMIIIIGISVNTGTDSLDNTKLQAFYTELGIIQKRVDDIMTTNESYIGEGGNIIKLKDTGEKRTLGDILEKEGVQEDLFEIFGSIDISSLEFRYFTTRDLENLLNLRNIRHNVFIHFDSRTIISEQGVTVNGVTYHVLKNQLYFPNQNDNKNKTTELECDVNKVGEKYKITVTPITKGDLIANGTLKYKKSSSKYWETANGLEIIINELTEYNIKYTDSNNETISKTIILALNGEGNLTITVK